MVDLKISELTAATNITGAEFEIIQGGSNKRAAATLFTTGTITFVIDGGGSAITTGSKGYLEIPFGCTVNDWVIVADQSGSIVVDVKAANYSTFPTTASIAGTEKPTLSSVQKNQDTSLSSWSTITAGDILEFVVDSAATVQRVTVALQVTRA